MSASGDKMARIIHMPLNRGKWPLLPDQGSGDGVGRRIGGARVVALLAALLFAFAAWLPWLAIAYTFGGPAQPILVDGGTLAQALPFFVSSGAHYQPSGDTLLLKIIEGLWAGVSAAGVLLAPLLWLRPHTRSSRLALTLYGAWLLLALAFTLVVAWFIFFPPAFMTRGGSYVLQWRPAWGMWLAVLALLASAIVAAVLIRYDRSSPRISARAARSPIVRTRAGWVGMGLVTVGILLWGLGFMAIPWATVNCPITPLTVNHLVAGRCAALDSGDALAYFAAHVLPANAWNVAGGDYNLYGVLVGGGLFVLIALWRTPPSRIVCAWAALWLSGASVVAYLAYRGVGLILMANPVLASQATGTWVGASGVTTTLLGLLIAWLGIIPLERVATLAAPRHAAIAAIAPVAATDDAPAHLFASDDEFEVTSLR